MSVKCDQQLRDRIYYLFPTAQARMSRYSYINFFFTHHLQVYYEIIIDVGRVISVLAFLSGHRDDQRSIPYQVGCLLSFSFSSIATDSRLTKLR